MRRSWRWGRRRVGSSQQSATRSRDSWARVWRRSSDSSTTRGIPIGARSQLDDGLASTQVYRTGLPARVDARDPASATGPLHEPGRRAGLTSTVASPISVEGRLWGTISISADEPLPRGTEERLARWSELLATAIANAESRDALARLADEQAALRRVAVLVARQPSPDEVFTAVTEAVGRLLGADLAAMHIFPGDGTATTIAGWSAAGPILPIGTRLPLDGESVAARIFRTGAAARMDSYVDVEGGTAEIARGLHLRSTVGAPILVDG
ncbi:MAG: GAF domain-containing protein, partial [Actinobacteria bacterium]